MYPAAVSWATRTGASELFQRHAVPARVKQRRRLKSKSQGPNRIKIAIMKPSKASKQCTARKKTRNRISSMIKTSIFPMLSAAASGDTACGPGDCCGRALGEAACDVRRGRAGDHRRQRPLQARAPEGRGGRRPPPPSRPAPPLSLSLRFYGSHALSAPQMNEGASPTPSPLHDANTESHIRLH